MKPSCALLGFPFVWSCQSKLRFVGIAQIQGGWRHREEGITIHRLSDILLQSNNLINASKAAPVSLGRVQAGDLTSRRFIRHVSVLHICYTVPEHPSLQHRWEMWGAAPPACPFCRAQRCADWDGLRGLCPKGGWKELCNFLLNEWYTGLPWISYWKQKKNAVPFCSNAWTPFVQPKLKSMNHSHRGIHADKVLCTTLKNYP